MDLLCNRCSVLSLQMKFSLTVGGGGGSGGGICPEASEWCGGDALKLFKRTIGAQITME